MCLEFDVDVFEHAFSLRIVINDFFKGDESSSLNFGIRRNGGKPLTRINFRENLFFTTFLSEFAKVRPKDFKTCDSRNLCDN